MKSIIKKISVLAITVLMATTLNASNIIMGNNHNASKIDNQKVTKSKELRGVWVASVSNIDWPSKKGLSVEQQKREFLTILDNVKKWNMNAVFVQIKPSGDAFYPSKYAPWSEYLTGTQGINPGYDPLKFMVEEAHKRGIEFHAWFNPYRLSVSSSRDKLSKDNIGRKKPEWTVAYGGQLYLNPGIPEVNDYVVNSIVDVVKNYDVDGVHDWRRDNVNKLVEKLQSSIKKENENVEFGISPFGVWRNASTDPSRGSETKAGVQNYDDLYADILLWMNKGWIDYVAPQIYWNQGHKAAEYNTLVKWWSKYAGQTKTNLYIGQAAYKVNDWQNAKELINQVNFNRNYPEVKGSIFFSYKSLLTNPKNATSSLAQGPYANRENQGF